MEGFDIGVAHSRTPYFVGIYICKLPNGRTYDVYVCKGALLARLLDTSLPR